MVVESIYCVFTNSVIVAWPYKNSYLHLKKIYRKDENLELLGALMGSALSIVIYFLAFFSSIVYGLSGPEDQS